MDDPERVLSYLDFEIEEYPFGAAVLKPIVKQIKEQMRITEPTNLGAVVYGECLHSKTAHLHTLGNNRGNAMWPWVCNRDVTRVASWDEIYDPQLRSEGYEAGK